MRHLCKILCIVLSLVLIIGCAGYAVPVAAQKVSEEGLEAYWSFDEGSGAVAKDSAGVVDGRELTVARGTANWTDGKAGKAFYFDGSTVLSMNALKQISTLSITVGFWVKLDAFPEPGDTSAMNQFFANEDLAAIGKGSIDFGFQNGGLRSYAVNNFAQLSGDEIKTGLDNSKTYLESWHHFALVYDQDKETAKMYVDGKVVKESELSNILGVPIAIGKKKSATYHQCNFDIGGYISTEGKAIRTIKGAMDEFKIYSRALSDSEVEALTAAAAPASSTPATKASEGGTSETTLKETSQSTAAKETTTSTTAVETASSTAVKGDSTSVSDKDNSQSESSSEATQAGTKADASTASDIPASSSKNVATTGTENKPVNTAVLVIAIVLILAILAGAYFILKKRGSNK